MNSLGALLFGMSLIRVIICQHEREPPGHRPRQGPPMSNVNEEALTLGTLSMEGTHMVESKKVYLPFVSDSYGVLDKVEAFFMSTDPAYVQIWRPESATTYQLISQFWVRSKTTNVTKTISTASRNSMCPVLRAGDRLGIFSLGQNTPIAVRAAADGSIPIATRTTRINNGEEISFQNVEFHNQFSVKFFIHEVSETRGYQNGGMQRYAPCMREDRPTDSTAKQAINMQRTRRTTTTTARTTTKARTTLPPTTMTTTTTTTTTTNAREMAGAYGGVSLKSLAMGRLRTNGPQNGKKGTSDSPRVTSAKPPILGITTSYRTVFELDPVDTEHAPGNPTVARVPVVTDTGDGGRVLAAETEESSNTNVLTIAVAALAGVALIAITIAVVLATRRRCAERPRKRLVRTHQDSATIPIDLPTPTTKNPAYGVSCYFLDQYTSPIGLRNSETSTDGYTPVIPTRPHPGSGTRPVAIYDDISDDSRRRSSSSNPRRTSPFSAPVDHTYLDLISDDVDSGVGDSENGRSRPGSGATDSSS